jgi:vitamin B12 transporter
MFRASFFHNEFGRQIEYVGLDLIPELLPNLTPAQQNQLEQFLQANGAYEQSLNTRLIALWAWRRRSKAGLGGTSFCAAATPTWMRWCSGRLPTTMWRCWGRFRRTTEFLSARIRRCRGHVRSGARRILGFMTATYSTRKLTGLFTAAFASRSDDSDFLGGYDLNGGNSLLLPNRNLDYGYAKLDLGGSYQLLNVAGDLCAGGEPDQQSAHRADRVPEPAADGESRAQV